MNSIDDRSYFFDQGIRFTCQNCGDCCCGAPGIIRVTLEDIMRIASYLNQSPQDILNNSVSPYKEVYTIRERQDGCCLYYESGCRIYPVRPIQCRTYPFWFNNLRSEKNWNRVCRACPGINFGRLFSKEQILEILNRDV